MVFDIDLQIVQTHYETSGLDVDVKTVGNNCETNGFDVNLNTVQNPLWHKWFSRRMKRTPSDPAKQECTQGVGRLSIQAGIKLGGLFIFIFISILFQL